MRTVLRDLFVDRRDVVVPQPVMKGADHGGVAAGEHAQDTTLGAVSFSLAAQLHQHLVAVHGRPEGLGGDVNVARDGDALAGVGHNEPVPVAMHGQASGDEVLPGCGLRRDG